MTVNHTFGNALPADPAGYLRILADEVWLPAVNALFDLIGPNTFHVVVAISGFENGELSATAADVPGHSEYLRWFLAEWLGGVARLARDEGLDAAVALRALEPGKPDRVYIWRFLDGRMVPLGAEETRLAYCTDTETGGPVPPEPDAEYCAGAELMPDAV
ncbi:hypothetical protein AB0G74_32445 [Streptomyces sp. NPDC020875]|uniref:hypothetical protein n=1 Tax=Streptomyces sp. NPDC020875 TaxID=3154898 RepID=UPI0033EA6CF9